MKLTLSRVSTLAAACVVVLASGCMVGPDFKQPPAPDVKGYTAKPLPLTASGAEGVKGSGAQHLNIGADIPGQWWTMFHSPQLNALVVEAIKSNPDLEAAKATLRQAHETYLADFGELFPQLDASFSATRQKSSSALFGSPGGAANIYTLYNAQLKVSYALDIFGGARRAIEQQKATIDYQRFELEGAYLTLTANVANAVNQVALRRTQIQLTEDNITSQQKIVDILRRQLRFGGASQAAVQLQLSQLAQLQAQLPTLRKQLAQQEDLLAVLTGRFPSELKPLDLDVSQFSLPPELPISLPSRLVEQRPDIRAAQAQLHEASAAIGVATAAQLPQITISGDIGSVAAHPQDLFSPGGGIWSIGGNLLQPLFDGGRLLHQKRAAVAAYDRAAAQYRSTVLKAFQDVADTLRAIGADSDDLRAQLAAERAAKKSYDIAQAQLKIGSISYPTLLQSELTYQSTRSAVVVAKVARLGDTIALYQALGGGWWNRKDIDSEADPGATTANVPITSTQSIPAGADEDRDASSMDIKQPAASPATQKREMQ